MLYELAHIIKDKFAFLWNIVESLNGWAFGCLYKGKIAKLNDVLSKYDGAYKLRMTTLEDVKSLTFFFKAQPESSFEFFHPHGFDEKSLKCIIKNKAFQTFVVTEGEKIVGYFFLRSFVNGKCFRGRIADYRTRGKGVGKLMAQAIEKIAVFEGLRMFASISPDNLASLNSAKAVSEVEVIKTLENGYYYVEVMPKSAKNQLGGVIFVLPIVRFRQEQVFNYKLAA